MSYDDPPIEESLLDLFPFPVEVLPGASILPAMSASLARFQNACPVILGNEFSVSRLAEEFEDGAPRWSPEIILERAARVSVDGFLAERLAELAEQNAESEPPAGPTSVHTEAGPQGVIMEARVNARFGVDGIQFVDGLPRGPWPEDAGSKQTELGGFVDILTGQPLRECALAHIPVAQTRPWEVFAHLCFGAWNECPEPAIHVALAKDWHERFGARIITAHFDTVEFKVDRPVSTREDAMELAREFYAYCPDIVDQGTGTIDSLAATMLGAKVWFFWWD